MEVIPFWNKMKTEVFFYRLTLPLKHELRVLDNYICGPDMVPLKQREKERRDKIANCVW